MIGADAGTEEFSPRGDAGCAVSVKVIAIVELRSKPNPNSSRIIVDLDTRFTRCDRVKKWLRALVGCFGRAVTPHLALYLFTLRPLPFMA
jgi:hypothetical protein